jgi:hypothetical protein
MWLENHALALENQTERYCFCESVLHTFLFGTDCDQDRITWGNPQKWCSDSLPFLMGHLGVRALAGFNFILFWNFNRITRRMIDIDKKITFYFLQNVWKCTVFFAFAFKVCKKCYYGPENFFLETYHYGYQKNAGFYADIKFVDAGFQKCS